MYLNLLLKNILFFLNLPYRTSVCLTKVMKYFEGNDENFVPESLHL